MTTEIQDAHMTTLHSDRRKKTGPGLTPGPGSHDIDSRTLRVKRDVVKTDCRVTRPHALPCPQVL